MGSRIFGFLNGLLAMLLFAGGTTAVAQPVSSDAAGTAFSQRATQLPKLLAGEVAPQDYFTADFLRAIPPDQIIAFNASLRSQHGNVGDVDRLAATSADAGTVFVRFKKAVVEFQLVTDSEQQGKVAGLRMIGAAPKEDSFAKIGSDIDALPGLKGLIIRPLGREQSPFLSLGADRPLAIASTFKLFILAELDDQIKRGKRKWSDVVRLDRRVFSSSASDDWPLNAPVTLHTLAAWMIAESDNAATDQLIAILGRGPVGDRMRKIIGANARQSLPLLTTVETFALKSPSNADLRLRYIASGEQERAVLLSRERARLTLAAVANRPAQTAPEHIDSIEWFAAPNDIAALMEYMRSAASADAKAILAMNAGVDPSTAGRWRYIGYKGGSEMGVISMSFLLESQKGRWYVVSGSWNNPAAEVNEDAFTDYMRRAINLLADTDEASS
jgi:beta-lactamase class A